mmetsp:Transcript_5652/g.13464  ORF Transcript_5652/g.13464 Transcript_5652/m.13464 type:complete len:248 (-) Transcript_5652:1582-2325(-)
MCAEVEDGIGLKDLLKVGVVGGEAMVGRGALGEEQTHRIALVAEGRLHADEDITELLAEHQHVLPVRVQIARCLAPGLLEVSVVRGELLVLVDGHAVGDIERWRVVLGLLVVEDGIHEGLRALGDLAHVVPVFLEITQHLLDGSKDVEVGSRADVALVGGKREHRDSKLLVFILLPPKRGPLEQPLGQEVDAVTHGHVPAREPLPAREDDGLNGAVDLGQGHLQGDLHWVEAQLGLLPLLKGLEDQR